MAKRRTKYPPPSTVKFATFTRRATPKMLARGGLPAMVVLSQMVTTVVPPQYGNFVVTTKQPVAPIKMRYRAFANEEGFLDMELTFKSYVPLAPLPLRLRALLLHLRLLGDAQVLAALHEWFGLGLPLCLGGHEVQLLARGHPHLRLLGDA